METGNATGGAGGAISLSVGDGNTGAGGATVTAGKTTADSAAGGALTLTAHGDGSSGAVGGAVSIAGGVGANSGAECASGVGRRLGLHDDRDRQLGLFRVSGDMAADNRGRLHRGDGGVYGGDGHATGGAGGAISLAWGMAHRARRGATVRLARPPLTASVALCRSLEVMAARGWRRRNGHWRQGRIHGRRRECDERRRDFGRLGLHDDRDRQLGLFRCQRRHGADNRGVGLRGDGGVYGGDGQRDWRRGGCDFPERGGWQHRRRRGGDHHRRRYF